SVVIASKGRKLSPVIATLKCAPAQLQGKQSVRWPACSFYEQRIVANRLLRFNSSAMLGVGARNDHSSNDRPHFGLSGKGLTLII
ncbi:hypothetical protein COY32_03010, partial [candidate division WWE3 bacterium CG_4_10_14_0_2_um_filter_41_14]